MHRRPPAVTSEESAQRYRGRVVGGWVGPGGVVAGRGRRWRRWRFVEIVVRQRRGWARWKSSVGSGCWRQTAQDTLRAAVPRTSLLLKTASAWVLHPRPNKAAHSRSQKPVRPLYPGPSARTVRSTASSRAACAEGREAGGRSIVNAATCLPSSQSSLARVQPAAQRRETRGGGLGSAANDAALPAPHRPPLLHQRPHQHLCAFKRQAPVQAHVHPVHLAPAACRGGAARAPRWGAGGG